MKKVFQWNKFNKKKYFSQFDTINEFINEIMIKNSTKKSLIKKRR